jgi:hypothetical protein
MLRRSTYFTAGYSPNRSRVSERLASREPAVGDSFDGARRKHTPGKEGDMRRIASLILVLVAIATAALTPAASADHGGVHGGSPSVRAM